MYIIQVITQWFETSFFLILLGIDKKLLNTSAQQTWGNRNRLHITVFWVIVIDWTDQKLNVIVIYYIANLIVIDDYFRD